MYICQNNFSKKNLKNNTVTIDHVQCSQGHVMCFFFGTGVAALPSADTLRPARAVAALFNTSGSEEKMNKGY